MYKQNKVDHRHFLRDMKLYIAVPRSAIQDWVL